MKIIIVGAGLSGLCTAISLRKYVRPKLAEPLEVKVYDEADIKPRGDIEYGNNDLSAIRSKGQGAAISLQANAFKVLRDIDPRLAERVYASGFPCKGFSWKTAGDWLLGYEYLEAHPVSRPLLVETLQEALPKGTVVYRTVSGAETGADGRAKVFFQDGGDEEADLVIGADGIRSPVRRSLFGDRAEYQPVYL